jgi:putative membrane protein
MYEWIKALHVIAVISWMAGMLYLPRLFVYHCDVEAGSKQSETFKVMERRLLKTIINPAVGGQPLPVTLSNRSAPALH